MSPDVFIQAPYNTQSYNRYSYVFNNPLSFVDPSGYTLEEITTTGDRCTVVSCVTDRFLIESILDSLQAYAVEQNNAFGAAVYVAVVVGDELFVADVTGAVRDIQNDDFTGAATNVGLAVFKPVKGGVKAAEALGLDSKKINNFKAKIEDKINKHTNGDNPDVGDGGPSATTPVGRRSSPGEQGADAPQPDGSGRHNPQHINGSTQKVQNAPGVVNGREYSGHAFDQMRNRGVTPTIVDNAIAAGKRLPGNTPGTSVYHDTVNNVRVVLNNAGRVITVE